MHTETVYASTDYTFPMFLSKYKIFVKFIMAVKQINWSITGQSY